MSKVRLLLIALLLALVGTGYWWYSHGGRAKVPTLVSSLPAPLGKVLGLNVSLPENIPTKLPSNVDLTTVTQSDQFSELTGQAKTAVDRAGTVLGTAVQVASGSGSIQEKTFNYARYLYCQQVVQEYEQKK
ncbi:hypothetical protein KA082_02950 [Candidatus Woesebacteria bacterium]|nr:hypothetical protein [Candidatus Woesebacteria bacterium]